MQVAWKHGVTIDLCEALFAYKVPHTYTWWSVFMVINDEGTHMHAHIPVSNLVLIALPKATIFGLPFTVTKMAQTDLNASTVHFSFKHLWRILFCCVVSLVSVMAL